MSPSDVAVVILNWNGQADTLACLDSLQGQQGIGILAIVVDNGSGDGSVSAIRSAFPTVTIIETGANLGYAGGNNVGLRYALNRGYRYMMVLNNDTVLDPHCIAHLLAGLEACPQAAAAAPKILFHDRPNVIYYAGGIVTAQGRTDHVGYDQPDGDEYGHSTATEWLTGCAILFRASALMDVGLFEEKFFLVYEDVDWSLHARRKGYELIVVPEAKLWHKVSASFGDTWSPFYLYYYTRNSLLLVERNFTALRRPRLYYRAVRRAMYYGRVVEEKCQQTSSRLKQRSVWHATWDYMLRRFGQRSFS